MNTVQDVLKRASEQGIIFTEKEMSAITDAQRQERERLIATTPTLDANGFADKWAKFYPKFLSFIVSLGETVLTFAQTLIVSLGIPVVLVLLLIVEHQRVVHGIILFESDYTLANFAGMALVVLNLVLEFTVHYIEHKEGYTQERARVWSLRLWWHNMLYRLGIGDNWQAVEQSPASRYKSLLSLVTFTILALALVGSMKTIIEQTSGNWVDAIGYILTQSSLLLMLTWLGGLLFAVSAVLSAQGISRYVAIRCVEILSAQHSTATTTQDPHAPKVEQAGAMVANAILANRLARKAPKPIVEPKPSAPVYVMPIASDKKDALVFETLPEVSEVPNPFGQALQESEQGDLRSIVMPKHANGNGNGNGYSNKKE